MMLATLLYTYLVTLAAGVTGEIHYVDAGYNKVGMPDPKKYDLSRSLFHRKFYFTPIKSNDFY